MELPKIPILFENDQFVAINKPPNVVVNRAQTVMEPTVQDWAESQSWFPKTFSSDISQEDQELYTFRSGVVHRLDKDTSGVMLLAKTPKALLELMRQFRERETEKTYLALVHGKFSTTEGIVNLPLGRGNGDREKFTVDPEGKESETYYKILQYYPQAPAFLGGKKTKSYQGFSVIELKPKTGRTHQIRVHMSYIKHPLVSDVKYAGKKRIKTDLDWCPRQFLHAKQLCIMNLDGTKQQQCFEAPLAEDLEKVLDMLHTANI